MYDEDNEYVAIISLTRSSSSSASAVVESAEQSQSFIVCYFHRYWQQERAALLAAAGSDIFLATPSIKILLLGTLFWPIVAPLDT